jgi:hypothetical protein
LARTSCTEKGGLSGRARNTSLQTQLSLRHRKNIITLAGESLDRSTPRIEDDPRHYDVKAACRGAPRWFTTLCFPPRCNQAVVSTHKTEPLESRDDKSKENGTIHATGKPIFSQRSSWHWQVFSPVPELLRRYKSWMLAGSKFTSHFDDCPRYLSPSPASLSFSISLIICSFILFCYILPHPCLTFGSRCRHCGNYLDFLPPITATVLSTFSGSGQRMASSFPIPILITMPWCRKQYR